MIPPLQMPGMRIARAADPHGELMGFVHLMQNALVAAAISLQDYEQSVAAGRMDIDARRANPWGRQIDPAHRLMVRNRPFVAASGFALSLERIHKIIEKIQKVEPELKDAAIGALAHIDGALPGLKSVRNSSAHVEDRNLKLGRCGKPIPVTDTYWVESLVNDHLVFTGADGENAKVHVHQDALNAAAQAVQKVIDALDWELDAHAWP